MTNTEPKSFLLCTWEGGGSVAPVLTVAHKLACRGHRVRVMSDACNRPEAEAAGARFVPWTRAPSRPDRYPASDPIRDWEYEGPEGLMQVIRKVWAGPALDYAEDVMAELEREPADLVVTSEFLFGVAIGCEAVGQPFVLMPVNVSLFPVAGVPPMGLGLPPARTEAERALEAEATAGLTALLDTGLPAVNAARVRLGLPPLNHTVELANRAQAMLIATARAFDFAPDRLPAAVRYVGPQLGEPSWTQGWSSPFSPGDKRPLVLVSFSTTFQNHAAVLQRTIDALSALAVRAVVTLGGSVPAEALNAAPNVRLVESAPHNAVMREATVVVTHGGHGTVCRALVHGRPMLVLPHGRDQNDNAMRVTERDAGLALPPTASTADIRAALARLLTEPGFYEAARGLGAEVAREAYNSPVAKLLEDLAERPVQVAA
jgi:MGT family glycosyltransferase